MRSCISCLSFGCCFFQKLSGRFSGSASRPAPTDINTPVVMVYRDGGMAVFGVPLDDLTVATNLAGMLGMPPDITASSFTSLDPPPAAWPKSPPPFPKHGITTPMNPNSTVAGIEPEGLQFATLPNSRFREPALAAA